MVGIRNELDALYHEDTISCYAIRVKVASGLEKYRNRLKKQSRNLEKQLLSPKNKARLKSYSKAFLNNIGLDSAGRARLGAEALKAIKYDLPTYIGKNLLADKGFDIATGILDLATPDLDTFLPNTSEKSKAELEKLVEDNEQANEKAVAEEEENLAKLKAEKEENLRREQENLETRIARMKEKREQAKIEKLKEKERDTLSLHTNTHKIHRDYRKMNQLKKPGIFFLRGLKVLGISTDYSGVEDLADAVKGARMYDYDQVDDVLWEIEKRHFSQPIILIGHSLGADSAVEIANKLNTLDYNFRKVDLLVTLDSVGANNDIIPQNVSKNLNYFGENSWLLNDGPNIARDVDQTTVINELRPEDHDELDDARDIQYDIINHIRDILE